MPKCAFPDCPYSTQYKQTKQIYCQMHLARIKRHGYPENKLNAYQDLENLPHEFVDNYIQQHCKTMIDSNIAKNLYKMGFKTATQSNVKYRRRKLGVKKYLSGDILKHRVWIRDQAIKKYGNKCELCKYDLTVDVHHIKPKKNGGVHEIDNLMVLCPNCHALLTRSIIILENRNDLLKAKKQITQLLKKFKPIQTTIYRGNA